MEVFIKNIIIQFINLSEGLKMTVLRNNGQFSFNANDEVVIKEKKGDMTREPWLMLMARRNKSPLDTLCWGLTSNGTSFARIGTQEGDILNGFVHEDPYKTRLLGNYVYFRTEDEKYFSNSWYPCVQNEQEVETTFGFGFAKFNTSYNDFDVETVNFVPNEFDAMVTVVKITNNAKVARKVTMFNTAPINIGDAREIQFSGFNTLMMGGGIIDKEVNAAVWRYGYGRPFESDEERINSMFGKVAVHTSSLEGNTFSTRYDEFVGHHTNTMANPDAVALNQDLPNRDAHENCSSLSALKNGFELAAGETKEIVLTLVTSSTEDYYCEGKSELKTFLAKVLVPANALKMLDEVKAEWKAELAMLNINVDGAEGDDAKLAPSYKWLQYQCAMVALLNRMKSRYHSGFEYGYGFRDILQDILALLPYDPAPAKELIKFTAKQMFSDGFVYHNFFVSAEGNKDFVTADDPLWLVYAVVEYIKESGDVAFLDEIVPFIDGEGTMLEHLTIAVDKVWGQSDEGLPYMLMADWNDDLSGLFTHTSTMAAQQLFKAYNDLIELFEAKGIKLDLVADYRAKTEVIKNSVESKCIDKNGNYIRALAPADYNEVLKSLDMGKSECDLDEVKQEMEDAGVSPEDMGNSETDGFTFFEPIAWAGFSGIADKARFDLCMAACEKDLDDMYGIAICQGDTLMTEGKLPVDGQAWKRNAPGKKENGGQFRHLESWYIASLCKFGYGQKAHDVYIKTLPAVSSSHDPYNYAVERFVFPEYVSGPASNDHGKGGHTWLTGTAPTRLNVIIDWMYGLRREYDGLLVDPCVAPAWKEFSATRTFRGTTINVTYSNPAGVEKGVKSVTVDGKALDGTLIPASLCTGGTLEVKVVMG
jgi:cellobiose phosphorylase